MNLLVQDRKNILKKILSYSTHNYDSSQYSGGNLRFLELLEGLSKKGYNI